MSAAKPAGERVREREREREIGKRSSKREQQAIKLIIVANMA